MPRHHESFRHIFVRDDGEARRFKPVGGGGKEVPYRRNPVAHGRFLEGRLKEAVKLSDSQADEANLVGINETKNGLYLEFEVPSGVPLPMEKFEDARRGIELLSVKQLDRTVSAVVFVPADVEHSFADKIAAYLSDRRTRKNKRLNRPFIDAIEDIDAAGLKSLWTGAPQTFPASGVKCWWEVWLRADTLAEFDRIAQKLAVNRVASVLRFPDRIVLLVQASAEELEKTRLATGALAELRPVESATLFFIDREPELQRDVADQLRGRIVFAAADAPAVTLLDNGVNNAHPLLGPALDEGDRHVTDPAWPKSDNPNTHGSAMAGLALYGDLGNVLANGAPISLRHRLESVRILPPIGANDPLLYGAITAEAIARVEIAKPARERVFCLSATAPGAPESGRPSSWSAELDRLTSAEDGVGDKPKRLIVAAAGNIRDFTILPDYLAQNVSSPCESPSQSWNAIAVGAYTTRSVIAGAAFAGWRAIAPEGDLSPSSRTSVAWNSEWPIKPDVLMEGGNWAAEPAQPSADNLEQLSVLTTSSRLPNRLFEAFGDTSAAAALVARVAGDLSAEYEQIWPETVRALIVHSARWTSKMQRKFDNEQMGGRAKWLRTYGYGVPDLERALHSARNELALVAQSNLQPFGLSGQNITLKDIKTFSLPWPVEALRDLGDAPIELRVTLSYFVEPNPAERGWRGRHRYRSHGLRFKLKRANESPAQFQKRINQAAREEDEEYVPSVVEQDGWYLGPRNRDVGSIHSDFLVDSAASLAQRGMIAVYPVSGWWKERKALARYERDVRFSLVVSLRSDNVEVDVYTPIAAVVEAQIEI